MRAPSTGGSASPNSAKRRGASRPSPAITNASSLGPEIEGPHGFPLSELKRYRDVIQYLGPQADPRPYMARTHVFVLPARGDAIPQALIEAIAMGRPVITSTSRGCRVAVREGGNGMIVPPGDASALAGAMARLLLRPDLIPAMARASRGVRRSSVRQPAASTPAWSPRSTFETP